MKHLEFRRLFQDKTHIVSRVWIVTDRGVTRVSFKTYNKVRRSEVSADTVEEYGLAKR